MTETVVLSDVEKFSGTSKAGKPYTKWTLKDGNARVIGATFSAPLGDAAQSLIGQRIDVELKPADDPKFAPTVIAVWPAKEEQSANGGPSDEGLTKQEWRLKDRAADKRACIAIAASALTHTLKSEPSAEDLKTFSLRVLRLSTIFVEAVDQARDGTDQTDPPFS